MIFRFLGLLLILIASVYLSELYSDSIKNAILLQDGMLSLLREISRSLCTYRVPLHEIYEGFKNDSLKEIGFLCDLQSLPIREVFLKRRKSFRYQGSDERMLLSYFQKLGTLPLSEEIVSCRMIIEVLQTTLDQKKEAYPKERKINLVLGITVGVSLVIVFI